MTAALLPTVARIVMPRIDAALRRNVLIAAVPPAPKVASVPVAAPALAPKALRIRVGTSRATDCHRPALSTGIRPACLQAAAVSASPSPDPEPPKPKPPKQQSWEDIQDLPPMRLSLVPLGELVDESEPVLNAPIDFETAKAQIEAGKARRRAVVETLKAMGIAA